MSVRFLVPAVGLCLLLAPGWTWAEPPPSVGLFRPGLSNPSPSLLPSPGQLAAPLTPPAAPAAGDRARPAGTPPLVALPTGLSAAPALAAGAPADPVTLPAPATNEYRLTLDEARQRVLANSKLLNLAAENIRSKEYATRAAQSDYFPKIIGGVVYMHYDDDLGSVLQFGGRTFRGRLGREFLIPSRTRAIPVILQDSELAYVTAVQPITDLLKVRQGVNIARADEQIAQAQLEKGTRELLSGVEQLFWGLLAAQRIRAGAAVAVGGAEELAKTGSPEAKVALVEARQGLQQVENQIADLTEQLAILLDVPTCTRFELVEPPTPVAPVHCADEVISLALAASPEIREAEQTVNKARAAVAAAKVDCLPNVALVGGYVNNNSLPSIQPNFEFVGAIGTYTFVDWGKRRNVIREREELVAMATLKVQQTQDQVRQNALKAFREYEESGKAFGLAGELVEAQKAAEKAAATPAAKFKAAKDLAEAQVDYLKADLAPAGRLREADGHPRQAVACLAGPPVPGEPTTA
jgi:outer membrane protein